MTHLPAPACDTRFDSDSVLEFFEHWKGIKDNGLRLGQAFHNYFKLHKANQSKKAFDWLYEADNNSAKVFIRDITSPSNQ